MEERFLDCFGLCWRKIVAFHPGQRTLAAVVGARLVGNLDEVKRNADQAGRIPLFPGPQFPFAMVLSTAVSANTIRIHSRMMGRIPSRESRETKAIACCSKGVQLHKKWSENEMASVLRR